MTRLLLIVALAAAATGCEGSDAVVVPNEKLPGTYLLASYNGGALPASLGTSNGEAVRVIFGSLVLNEDGTCSKSETVVRTKDGISRTEATVDTCQYQIVVGTDRLSLYIEESLQGAAFGPGVVQLEKLATVREYRRQ